MRISDWSSDVCSSDLGDRAAMADSAAGARDGADAGRAVRSRNLQRAGIADLVVAVLGDGGAAGQGDRSCGTDRHVIGGAIGDGRGADGGGGGGTDGGFRRRIGHRRSEEHTSELQSLMRISYAVFCLKKKTKTYM